MKRVAVLLSGITGAGGIQRYNRTLCMALSERLEPAAAVHVVSLHDAPGRYDHQLLSKPIVASGGRRPHFVGSALAALSRRPDAVVVGHIDLSPLVTVAPALYRHRVMTIVHGIEVWSPLPLIKRLPLNKSEVIWAASRYTADKVVQHQGTSRQRIQIVHPPLHPDFSPGAVNLVARPPLDRLLTIARLDATDRTKGVDDVIRAVAAIQQTVPTVTYTIVGDGDDRHRLEQLSKTYGVNSIVHFAGHVSDDALHGHIAASDIFVMPSSKEGFGMVYGEAMAYGKPVVAGAFAGASEAVIDGHTGLLVTPGDHRELVRAITTLLEDPALAARMGLAGRRWAESNLNYSIFCDAVESVVWNLLNA